MNLPSFWKSLGVGGLLILLLTPDVKAQLSNAPIQGNKAFESGEYANAVELYRIGLEKKPENSQLLFNLGNALSMLGDQEQSLEAFQAFKQREVTPIEASMADYNIGTLLAQENPEAAMEALKESLKKNPLDEDAKFNLELLLQQQQQEQQQDQNQEQDEQEQDQDQQQQQQNQNQDQNGDPDQNQQPQNQDQQNSQSDQQKQQQQQPSLQPREAEALLDALAQREKDLLRAMKKEASETQPKTTKDW